MIRTYCNVATTGIHWYTLVTVTSPYRYRVHIMIVYTVETIGGQITSYEANKEN